MAKTLHSQYREPGILGQRTRPHMQLRGCIPQLKIPRAATRLKILHSTTKINLKKKKKKYKLCLKKSSLGKKQTTTNHRPQGQRF